MPPYRPCAYLVVTVGSSPVGFVVVATPKSRVVAATLCCVWCGESVFSGFFGKEWRRLFLSGASSSFINSGRVRGAK